MDEPCRKKSIDPWRDPNDQCCRRRFTADSSKDFWSNPDDRRTLVSQASPASQLTNPCFCVVVLHGSSIGQPSSILIMYYPPKIIGILIAMILTGAARSVCVKLFYQMGFVNPLFVTLLYLLGHSMALLVYGISRYLESKETTEEESRHGLNSLISKSLHRTSLHDVIGSLLHDNDTNDGRIADGSSSDSDTAKHVSFWGILPLGSFDQGKFASTANAFRQFTSAPKLLSYGMFLVLLFLINGIANILTTCATSSMTRNVWKNIRTALVWVLGLVTFYTAYNNKLGEPWETPKSFLLLVGVFIMLAGIYTYYHQPAERKLNASSYLDEEEPQTHERDQQLVMNADVVKSIGSMVTLNHGNTAMRHRNNAVPSPTFLMHAVVSEQKRQGRLQTSP